MKRTFAYSFGISMVAMYIGISNTVTAQQLPQFSQYMHNMYLLNPAAACVQSDAEINLGFRQQWTGFDAAPQTYYINGALNLGKKPMDDSAYLLAIPISAPGLLSAKSSSERYAKHIVSAMAAVDEYGLFKRTSAMAGYAYHRPIGEKFISLAPE